ncbi:Carboxylesterase A precursor [Actinomadura rubteroloni]|uniref:Carboxylesterase A n=1 Tax=Actinomadura rubteroloni TaxID=1926885 RepID=A0A2P4UNM1_9ACTN|nr:alpha/beta hydrolase [Actinomadura rubteroloni]POM26646.1 Carboxylesterase A precursor [Actinomadura rubteroloni]
MRAKTISAAVTALVLALASACTSDPKSAPPPPSPSSSRQGLDWKACGDGFQCGTVQVPLDYAHPSAGTIGIAMIRLPASDPSGRIGSLFTNPGGPGGSGIDFVRQAARSFGADVRRKFDIVGFDPRGVGQSDPVRCLSGPQLDTFFSTDVSPDDGAEIDVLAAQSKNFATSCGSRAGALLPHVGTRDAAHDMDLLRAAVGDAKLTYYGASYGTYLGAVYAEQFPTHIRSLVLDGALDPKISSADVLVQQARGFETAFRAFAADCVQSPGCPLGTTVSGALTRLSDFQKQLDRTPLANTRDARKVTEAGATMGIATALYAKESWPYLRQALTQAFTRHDGTLLLTLADTMVERKPDGTYSNETEANMAVNCADKPNPPSLPAYQSYADKARQESPRFGAFVVWGGLPCVYWPTQTKQAPHAIKAKGSPPILVVGTTRDPATPYQWAQSLASELDKGVLLSLNGDGHTAYLQGDPCITSATDRYLLTGTPPRDGTHCN